MQSRSSCTSLFLSDYAVGLRCMLALALVALAFGPVAPLAQVYGSPTLAEVVSLSVDDIMVTEGDSFTETTPADFTVSLTPELPVGAEVTVDYTTVEDTAFAGSDYQPRTGTLTFRSGEPLSQTLTIQTIGNELYDGEVQKRFQVQLSNPQLTGTTVYEAATLADGEGTATILDNEEEPTVRIEDVATIEGIEGSETIALFRVRLSNASRFGITVDYEPIACPEDICATPNVDFMPIEAGRLTFDSGDTEATIPVTILDEGRPEQEEVLRVQLTDTTNVGSTEKGIGTMTIRDDNDEPVLSFETPSFTAVENDNTALISVTLNFPHYLPVSVSYETEAGSAEERDDYRAISDPDPPLAFAPGEMTQAFEVDLRNDSVQESEESLTLRLLRPTNASLDDQPEAELRIIDDDSAPVLTIEGASRPVQENDEDATLVELRVRLTPESIEEVSVDYVIETPTNLLPIEQATAGEDYSFVDGSPASGTLQFAPGDRNQEIEVLVNSDLIDEADETFQVRLLEGSVQGNAALSSEAERTRIAVQIADDDGPTVAFSQTQYSASEGDGSAQIAVDLAASSPQSITVEYATVPSTAVPDSDYVPTNGTLNFGPGETRQSFEVELLEDLRGEDPEDVLLTLSDPLNATLGDPITATLTLQDNEMLPVLAFTQPAYQGTESAGTAVVTLTALVASPPERDIDVQIQTVDGTAQGANDFGIISQTVTISLQDLITDTMTVFTPTVVTDTVIVTIIDDEDEESAETFGLLLGSVRGATLGAQRETTITIPTNDQPAARIYLPLIFGPSPVVRFSAASYTIPEETGAATLDVIIGGPPRITSTVRYEATSIMNSAEVGTDYLTTTGVLTFTPGLTATQQLQVPIVDDNVGETDEQLLVVLSQPTGDLRIGEASTTLLIIDNDTAALSRLPALPDE